MNLDTEQQLLVEENMALVHKVIRDRVHGASGIGIFSYDDLYQIGCIGLCKAVATDKYDYAHNRQKTRSDCQLSTYAYRLIWHEICTMLSYATKVRVESAAEPTDIDALCREYEPDSKIAGMDLQVALNEELEKVARHTSGVTAKGIKALKYLAEGYTSTEISGMMGAASCHHVTAWISKARNYLRADPVLLELYENPA